MRNQKAFTVVELIVIVAVIGLLASLLMIYLGDARTKSRDARRVADIQQISKALELYSNNCESYPQLPPATTGFVLNGGKALFSGANGCGTSQGINGDGGIGAAPHPPASGEVVFLPNFPTAPIPADNGGLVGNARCSAANTQLSNSTWNDYVYYSFGPNDYHVDFCISQPTGTLSAGHHSLRPEGIE